MDTNFNPENYDMYSDAPRAFGGEQNQVALDIQPQGNNVASIDEKINKLNEEMASNNAQIEQLQQTILGLKKKYAPTALNDAEMENQLAANRARRFKKDDGMLNHWRWQKQREDQAKRDALNYQWQMSEQSNDRSIANQETLRELDNAVDKASQAMIYAKTDEDKAMAKLEYEYALTKRNQFAKNAGIDLRESSAPKSDEAEQERKQIVDGYTLQIANWNVDGRDAANKAEIIKAINESNLRDSDKSELLKQFSKSQEELNAEAVSSAKATEKAKRVGEIAEAGKLNSDQIASKIRNGEALSNDIKNSKGYKDLKGIIAKRYESYKSLSGTAKTMMWEANKKLFAEFGFKE